MVAIHRQREGSKNKQKWNIQSKGKEARTLGKSRTSSFAGKAEAQLEVQN